MPEGKNYSNDVIKPLSKQSRIYAVDSYGHGGNLHGAFKYKEFVRCITVHTNLR